MSERGARTGGGPRDGDAPREGGAPETLTVRDVMIRDLTALSAEDTLGDAARTFAMLRLTGLPVVDEEYRVVGFLSEADIIKSVVPAPRDRSALFVHNFGEIARKMGQVGVQKVGEHMTGRPLTVTEDEDLMAISETMLREHFKILPVVRGDRLVGMVNRADVCRALMEHRESVDEWEA